MSKIAPRRGEWVVDMKAETAIGDPSLQMRSTRLITALRRDRSYGGCCLSVAPAATIVGTQSRSIETRFASRDNRSKIPNARIKRKTASLHWCSFSGRASVGSMAPSVASGASFRTSFVIMAAQQTQAAMTTTRLTETVVKRVRSREGARSTQRPREEAKTMMPRLVVIPLRLVVTKTPPKRGDGQDLHPRSRTETFRKRGGGEEDRSELIRPRVPRRQEMAKVQIVQCPVPTRPELRHERFDARRSQRWTRARTISRNEPASPCSPEVIQDATIDKCCIYMEWEGYAERMTPASWRRQFASVK